jgi:thiamine kinase-like enzyme
MKCGIIIPKVLFFDSTPEFTVLITDDKLSPPKTVESKICKEHIIAIKTLMSIESQLSTPVQNFNLEDYSDFISGCSDSWKDYWSQLVTLGVNHITCKFSHGDFTITNSAIQSGGVYIFDWEYASFFRPKGYDLLTLFLSVKSTMSSEDKVEQLVSLFQKVFMEISKEETLHLVTINLFAHSLFYLQRDRTANNNSSSWANESLVADMIRVLLTLLTRDQKR